MIAKLCARKRSSTSGCMIMFTCLAYAAPLGGTGEQIDRQTGIHLMPPQEHTPGRRARREGGTAFRGCDHECAQAHRRFGV